MRDRDAEDVVATLQAVGVAAGVVADAADLCERDPQLAARGYWVDAAPAAGEPGAEACLVDGPMPRLAATPGRVGGPGPRLGEHTAEVLRQRLGLAPLAIDRLRAIHACS
jgi:benzylsuccinate CoA-transferase BbsF subunit